MKEDAQVVARRLRAVAPETVVGELIRAADDRGSAVLRVVEAALQAHPQYRRVSEEVTTLLRLAPALSTIEDQLTGEPRLLTEEELGQLMSPGDLATEATLRGEVRHLVFREEMLTAAQVSKLLGSESVNPRQYANSLRRRGVIIGVPYRNRFVYPAFQFDLARRRVRPVVGEVNRILNARDDPWGVAAWWLLPNARLSRRRPKDLLGEDDMSETLRAVAEAVSEPLG